MKRFADKQEPIVMIPSIVEPVVVKNTPIRVAVQNSDIPIAVISNTL